MNIANIIKDTSKSIVNERSSTSIFLCMTEELGEIGQEIRVKYMPDCYKTGDVDGILGEGSDLIIGTMDLLFNEGYSIEEITAKVAQKCAKWESKANGGK